MSKKRGLLREGARTTLTLALGVASAMVATPTLAQEEEEEIVVTATQRSTALQDVPVAVTAVSSEMVENAGIRDLQDLTSVAPSLQFNVSENETSATARLRGIGTQGSNPGLESAVGIFIDGVYRARNGVALSDLGEVRQIEVLRGPQGTLFGRNTSAGLITVRTAAPNLQEFNATGELTYGAYGEQRFAVSVDVPMVEDEVGFRLFGAVANRDGFMDVMNAAGSVTDANDRDMWTVRGQLLWDITDNIEFRLIGDLTERNETCCAASIYNPTALNGVTTFATSPTTTGTVQFPNTTGVAPLFGGSAQQYIVGALGGYGPPTNGLPPIAAEAAALQERLALGDISARRAFANIPFDQDLLDYGVSAEVDWELGGGVTLTSITAQRNWIYEQGQDTDFSAADLWGRVNDGDNGFAFDIFTQELRLAGEWGRLDWLVGLYYSDETLTRGDNLAAGAQFGTYFATLGALAAPTFNTSSGNPVPIVFNPFLTLGAVPGGAGVDDHYRQESNSLAFFTHNIISLGPNTDFTIGVRYTTEEKDLRATFDTSFDAGAIFFARVAALEAATPAGAPYFGPLPAGTLTPYANCDPSLQPAPLYRVAIATMRSAFCNPILRGSRDGTHLQSREEEEWSGVAALRHEFADFVNAYASYSRGYKAGGFNLDRNFSGAAFNTEFPAELVEAYEVGLKTTWFDRGLIVNLALFSSEYQNFQLNTFNGVSFQVTSVPEATSEGAELDVLWRTPIEGLSLQGGVVYTDARYGDDTAWVTASANPITGALTNFRLPGNHLSNAPEWTATSALTYERPLFGGSLIGLAYIDARYVSDQNTGSDLNPTKEQPAYTVVNARLGISALDERWSLEVWGRNVFDEEYAQIMFDIPLQTGTFGAFLGDPATYGVTLRARY